jgi:hypothetical protein
MPEDITIRLDLKASTEVVAALADLEDLFVHEGGWWSEPCGTVDHLCTELLVDDITYDSLSREEFLELLGLEPEWVINCYES